ncbi:MAG: transglutaminase domain-containing protein [Gemmatimonadetes bacterium]|nr:transglutaminase domain-containing protein [Gemmatimonadota bacterium]
MPLLSRRRLLAYGVLAVWASVVAVHVRREYLKPLAVRLAGGARTLEPGVLFYTVRMQDRAIGVATSRLDTVATGFIFQDLLTLDVPALGAVHRALVRTRVDLGRALELRSFRFDLDSEIGRFRVRGEMQGDSMLDLELDTGGSRQRSRVPWSEIATLPTALPLRLAAGGRLAVGEEYQVRVFDPSTLAPRDVSIRVTGLQRMVVPTDSVIRDEARGRWVAATYDTVPAWRVEESFGGITMASWIDDDGRLLKAESPLGFTIERAASEIARQAWRESAADVRLAAGYGAIIEATAISSNVDIADVEAADRLAVRLLEVDLEGFDLAGGRQALRGDTLVITREEVADARAGYRLPYRGGGDAAAELEATPLIQAADPRIQAAARRIAGGETDAAAVAQRLNDWVYRTLDKDVTLSIPSALQVLEAQEGDCNEHTVLYVALARALGLPARTAVGLVLVQGRFYYHAWPEVWLGRWVAVDPTLGQFPADAAHLRFLVGGLARQIELVRLIGRLRLEVL